MDNLTLVLLAEGLSKESKLRSNPLAHQLFEWVSNKGSHPTESEFVGFSEKSNIKVNDINLSQYRISREFKDMRFLTLSLSEIRKFSRGENNLSYFLEFNMSNTPSSSIYMGSNSVGKTTLFNCIEWVLYGHLPSLRHSEEVNVENYMSNVDTNETGDIIIEDISKSKHSRYDSMRVPLCFVCSDADVLDLQRDGDLTGYVYRQLGLWDSFHFINFVIEDSLELIKKSVRESVLNSGDEEVNIDYEAWRTYALDLQTYLKFTLEKKLKYYFRKFIKPIFTDLFKEFQDKHQVVIKLNGLNFNAGVEMNKNIRPPYQYLNTFRLTLFCFALKVALCCCAKYIYHINLPLIVDDIFYSGDFDNRQRLVEFIKDTAKLHKRYWQDDLQLIFFTQDSLIGDGVYQGLNEFDGEYPVKLSRIKDCLLANIYEYNDYDSDFANSNALLLEDMISVFPINKV